VSSRTAAQDRAAEAERLDTVPEDRGWVQRHLLDVDVLTETELELVLDLAAQMAVVAEERRRLDDLAGTLVTLLFHEPSTRTRVSFELAAKRLGADVSSISVSASSVAKGESLVDTVRTLEALGSNVLVVRHARSGAPQLAARVFRGHVINAGDGWHAHPTQALLDLYTLRRHLGELRGRKIAIVGDVLHSRVARSAIWALTTMGVEVWVCGPPTLVRGFERWAAALPAERRLTVTSDLDPALRDSDAVIALRIQRERMSSGLLPSLAEYTSRYGLTAERLALARPGAIVLHPGPMNEGVEISMELAGGPRAVVTEQVTNGLAVRMAVLRLLVRGS
jgi:aspartate carbamoyltransferase catalytic subunit